ncbi:MAG TPA: lipoprotein-releasing ABC transporter permease subunit [Nitrospirae bacterium]|nr:lipoprotein-releasing system transmembrane protein LolC [bacterium BMS3Abin06]HDH11453.1 lipoprotein-releasing ABC transporter permease subunit [Nitrospirota bacterium]HDZ01393.1 lipoprotein-releasing ABC transporter permease subunit [Nitrospirota bacterium]
MNLPYQFFIALRYFKSKKKHSGVSINTLISIAGVALGVMTLITVLSVMSGFQEDLQEKILGVNSHIVTLSYKGRIRDYDAVREKISRVEGVVDAAPFIYGQAMLRSGSRAHGVVVRGIDPVTGTGTTDILQNLKAGSIDGLKRDTDIPGIIIGRELLRTLGLFVGDEIEMISPISEMGPLGMIPKMKKFKVAGYFEAGMYEYDSSLAFISLRAARKFFKYDDAVTGIEIKTDDLYNAKEIAAGIERLLKPPYYTRDWMQMNRNLFSALKLEKIVMFIILALIILVASFNIISNLIMIVIEKAREIAIMKTMGATNRGIMSIFMIHGLIIGITGTLIGVAGGYGLCLLLKTYKFINLPADVYYLSYLPVKLDLFDFLVVPAAAVFITFMATIYPSWQAAKLDPVESLRYE